MSRPVVTVENIRDILDKHDKGDPDKTIEYIWRLLDDENTEHIYIEADDTLYKISLLSLMAHQASSKVVVQKMSKETQKWSAPKEINKKKATQIAQGIKGVRI